MAHRGIKQRSGLRGSSHLISVGVRHRGPSVRPHRTGGYLLSLALAPAARRYRGSRGLRRRTLQPLLQEPRAVERRRNGQVAERESPRLAADSEGGLPHARRGGSRASHLSASPARPVGGRRAFSVVGERLGGSGRGGAWPLPAVGRRLTLYFGPRRSKRSGSRRFLRRTSSTRSPAPKTGKKI